MDPTEWAYLAGIVDGEGSICRVKGESVQLQVANTDRRLVEWIRGRFPEIGGVHFHRMRDRHARDYWTWAASGRPLRRVLVGIQPFVVLKAEQLRIALRVLDLVGVPDTRAARDGLLAGLTGLNWRGRKRPPSFPDGLESQRGS